MVTKIKQIFNILISQTHGNFTFLIPKINVSVEFKH